MWYLDDRVRKLHALQHDGRLLITQRLPSDDIFQASQCYDIPSAGNLHLITVSEHKTSL